jgi:phosphotransferase system enzyme I (PtsI)
MMIGQRESTSSPLYASDSQNGKSSSSTHEGFALTPGVAFGEAFVLKPQRTLPQKEELSIEDVSGEIEKFTHTLSIIKEELLFLQKQVAGDIGEAEGAIFEFQMRILEDVELMEKIVLAIRDKKMKVGQAIEHVLIQAESEYGGIKNSYFKDKFMDIRDVLTKLKDHHCHRGAAGFIENGADKILVTNEVDPSIIPPSPRQKIMGLVTTVGGLGSHATILARSYGIPGVGLTSEVIDKVKDGDRILIDGQTGKIFVNPSSDLLDDYQHTIRAFEQYRERVVKQATQAVKTKDGVSISINANCCTEVDLNQAKENGADGVGLFRTEFMFYVHATFPTETEQFEIYKEILTRFPDKPIVFRTLDIGGDKFLPYFSMPKQLNPFLGWRALKISFELPLLFKTQIKAILRAAQWGQARILFPMVTSYQDVIKVKEYIFLCKEELTKEGIEFNPHVPCGAMIEIPSAVSCLEDIAQEVDFLTIGTNDMTQHLLAVDRNNPRVAPFYISHHPAMIFVLEEIVRKAGLLGKPVSLCGEMASNPYYAILLFGLGITNLSMVPSYVPIMKDIVRNISLKEAREVAAYVKKLKYSHQILLYLKEKTIGLYPDVLNVLK